MRVQKKKFFFFITFLVLLTTIVSAQNVDVYSEQNFLTKLSLNLQKLNLFVITQAASGKYLKVETVREPLPPETMPVLVSTNDKKFVCNFDACVIYFYHPTTLELYGCSGCNPDFFGTGGLAARKLVRGQSLYVAKIPRAPYRYLFFGDNELERLPTDTFFTPTRSTADESSQVTVPIGRPSITDVTSGRLPSTGDKGLFSGFGTNVVIGCGVGTVLDLTTNKCVSPSDVGAKQRICEEEGSIFDGTNCVRCVSGEVIENHKCVKSSVVDGGLVNCVSGERLINFKCVSDEQELWVVSLPLVLAGLFVFFVLLFFVWRIKK